MCLHITTPLRGLPDNPLDAAAEFHTTHLPRIRHDVAIMPPDSLILLFDPAGHDHSAWRLAAVQALARELSPTRVNAVAGEDEAAVRETTDYLEQAPGVTGQLLSVQTG